MNRLNISMTFGRALVVLGLLGAIGVARRDGSVAIAALCVLAALVASLALIRPRRDMWAAAGLLMCLSMLLGWPNIAPFVGSAAYFLLMPANRYRAECGRLRS